MQTRAAKEDAERELGAVVAMFDQVRSDWQKKLKDRRKEVRAGGRGGGVRGRLLLGGEARHHA